MHYCIMSIFQVLFYSSYPSGFREEPYLTLAVEEVDGGLAASSVGGVEYIVVHQGGRVDHLRHLRHLTLRLK